MFSVKKFRHCIFYYSKLCHGPSHSRHRYTFLSHSNYLTNNMLLNRRSISTQPFLRSFYGEHLKLTVNNLAFARPGHFQAFHTTPIRCAGPLSVLVILLRPVLKVFVILFGRRFRNWWKKLPANKKKALIDKLRRHKVAIAVITSVLFGSSYIFYVTHLEEEPITKRRRFIIFSQDQMIQIAAVELQMEIEANKNLIVPPYHPVYRRVSKVAKRILKANSDIENLLDKDWSITVIDEPSVKNAFVLPNGNMFIFTGMLSVCSNDDQLGIILAHEMAHALLGHMAEQLSNIYLLELLILIPVLLFWAVLPDGAALISQWLSEKFAAVLLHLPFSRRLESEADEIGLQLAAKACFDVREASAFWKKMQYYEESEQFEWLSTHPTNETRQKTIDALLPSTIRLRESCQCPLLPPVDPRQLVTMLRDYK